ncbi:hypothetical protein Vau01_103230 [Virgisporangium aurantiacum]|uniref:Hint domain-containing protein n=1 Tax=Virgisporangium aurantiacum TaxID=175570 RepID=A0A8J3ZEV6_9ACTN|nr:hypothetical protein Vau01_103230 [Virgisporangium aurantiacum]
MAVADATSVGAEYSYDPFGRTTVSGDDAGNPTRFTGREDEGTDGLYYYRSRYYSATAGRFPSKDPIGLASGDTNPYRYVFNQPTVLTDPMGTKPSNSRGDCGQGNSFAAGTRVLMADGSTKPIEQVRVGDRVAAADPETGEKGARTVTATIVGDGEKTLIDVKVGDRGAVITATHGHPVWVDDDGRADTVAGRWIDARELRTGQWLKTSDGRLVQVAGTQARMRMPASTTSPSTTSTPTTWSLAVGRSSSTTVQRGRLRVKLRITSAVLPIRAR